MGGEERRGDRRRGEEEWGMHACRGSCEERGSSVESSVVIKQLANCDACVWLVAERMTGLITRDVLQHKVTIS